MDKPQRGSYRGHPARDRHRPDQPGAHLALHGRDDDGAQRSPQAAVRARGAAFTAGAAERRSDATRAEGIYAQLLARAGQCGDPRLTVTFPVSVPANFSEREVLDLLAKQGYTRVHAQAGADARDRAGPPARRRLPSAHGSSRRSRRRSRSGAGGSQRPRRGRVAGRMAVLLRPALPGLRHPLPRPDAEPVLLQLAARRLRHLPRLRACDRRRLRARDPGRVEDAAGRRDPPVADRGVPGMPGRPAQVRTQARRPGRRALAGAHR